MEAHRKESDRMAKEVWHDTKDSFEVENVNDSQNQDGKNLNSSSNIEELVRSPDDFGILTKLKDSDEGRDKAVADVLGDIKNGLNSPKLEGLPNDLDERQEKLNDIGSKVREDSELVRNKIKDTKIEIKELSDEFNSFKDDVLEGDREKSQKLQSRVQEIKESLENLRIGKEQLLGSNNEVKINIQVSEIAKETDRKSVDIQREIQSLKSHLDQILTQNQQHFSSKIDPLLQKEAKQISETPDPLSPVPSPDSEQLNSKLKDDFEDLLTNQHLPEEKPEKDFSHHKDPSEFFHALPENKEYEDEESFSDEDISQEELSEEKNFEIPQDLQEELDVSSGEKKENSPYKSQKKSSVSADRRSSFEDLKEGARRLSFTAIKDEER